MSGMRPQISRASSVAGAAAARDFAGLFELGPQVKLALAGFLSGAMQDVATAKQEAARLRAELDRYQSLEHKGN